MSNKIDLEIEFNEVTSKLPKSLHSFIVKQPYNEYTFQNQAVWRYVMRLNVDFLKNMAHESYINGLRLTGISIDDIPRMEGMNRILKDIGWAAVAVDGFIPPNAFMAFQAHNVLVISSEIRTIDHIGYTPAPDIIHEAAGHAPIIANAEYSEYLRRFAFFRSSEDVVLSAESLTNKYTTSKDLAASHFVTPSDLNPPLSNFLNPPIKLFLREELSLNPIFLSSASKLLDKPVNSSVTSLMVIPFSISLRFTLPLTSEIIGWFKGSQVANNSPDLIAAPSLTLISAP